MNGTAIRTQSVIRSWFPGSIATTCTLLELLSREMESGWEGREGRPRAVRVVWVRPSNREDAEGALSLPSDCVCKCCGRYVHRTGTF